MAQTVINLPAPLAQLNLTWPPLDRTIGAGGLTVGANCQYGPGSAASAFFDAPAGGGTDSMGRAHTNEIIVGQLVSGRSAVIGGFPIYPALTVGAWPAAFKLPTWYRVWRMEWIMAVQAGVPTEQTGLQFIVSAATVGGWVVAAANTGAFGIVGDGLGGWNFFTKKGAGTYLTTAITMPNVITEFIKFQIQVISASGGGAAGLTLLVNDQVVALPAARSSWAGATALPVMADGSVALSNKFVPAFQANDGAGVVLQFGMINCIAGHFAYDGTEK